ncbi:MAG: hypothetical protein AB8G99_11110 [Planctomycetaceae bacterium]
MKSLFKQSVKVTRAEFTRELCLRVPTMTAEYGDRLKQRACEMLFQREANRSDPKGYWRNGGLANYTGRKDRIKFRNGQDQRTMFDTLALVVPTDFAKKLQRRHYVDDLHNNVQSYRRELKSGMCIDQADEATRLDIAMAWASPGKNGTALVRRFVEKGRHGNRLPFTRPNLIAAWHAMKIIPPSPYRGWTVTAEKYPSVPGGIQVLERALNLAKFQPPQGDERWYDIGLFLLGSIIAAQPVLDGNKRLSRLVYAAVLLMGGVDLYFPTNQLIGRLGDMA